LRRIHRSPAIRYSHNNVVPIPHAAALIDTGFARVAIATAEIGRGSTAVSTLATVVNAEVLPVR
jgi:hypothetical protein